MDLRRRHLTFEPRVMGLLFAGAWLSGCGCGSCLAGTPDEETFARRRASLVSELRSEIRDQKVLSAIGKVPRHRFVPAAQVNEAYGNYPLPIGQGQTISQPFIVAYMTEALKLREGDKVLEVGTGSGYQAAILSELGARVYSLEILEELSQRAGRILSELGYHVALRVGDGWDGWAEEAPFDAIIITAAPREIPPPIVSQLREGGRLSVPLGPEGNQVLYTYVKRDGKLVELAKLDVRFVPMTGKALR